MNTELLNQIVTLAESLTAPQKAQFFHIIEELGGRPPVSEEPKESIFGKFAKKASQVSEEVKGKLPKVTVEFPNKNVEETK